MSTVTDQIVASAAVDGARPAQDTGWEAAVARHPKLLLMLADAVTAAVAVTVGPAIVGQTGPTPLLSWGILAGAAFLGAGTLSKLYQARFTALRGDEFRRIVSTGLWMAGVVVIGAWVIAVPVMRSWLLAAFAAVVLGVALEREISRLVLDTVRRHGYLLRKAVILGDNAEGEALARALTQDPTAGYELRGVIDVGAGPDLDHRLAVEQAIAELRSTGADSALVAATAFDAETSNRLIRRLSEENLNIELTSSLRDIAVRRLTVRPIGSFPVMYVEPRSRVGWRAVAKRTFDLAVAGIGLLLAMPILAVAAVAVKLDSRGPVLFDQTRVGRDGTQFRVLKLRTMVVDAEERRAELDDANEADGPLFKMAKDPRVTRVGRFLRKTSLDEVPQLWNVLRNEMSMVGPRPALPDEVDLWDPDLHERLLVKPGITGMWQVHGRSEADFDEYARLDLYYVHNWSLAVDLGIVARTIPAVVRSHGAY